MTPEINAISTVIFLFSLVMIVLWYRLRVRGGEEVADIVAAVTKEAA